MTKHFRIVIALPYRMSPWQELAVLAKDRHFASAPVAKCAVLAAVRQHDVAPVRHIGQPRSVNRIRDVAKCVR